MSTDRASLEQRGAPRAALGPDDHVMVNNVRFPLRNWSPFGLLFGPMGAPPNVGAKIEVKVAVKYRDDRIRFSAIAEVMRVDNGQVAVRYTCQTPEALPQIQAYFNVGRL